MKLEIFNTANLFDAATDLFQQLGVKLNSNTAGPLPAKDLLKQHYKDNHTFNSINHAYFIGIIDNTVFNAAGMFDVTYSYKEALQQGDKNYDGLMLFALDLSKQPTRSEISDLTRTFNRISQKMPVALVLKYPVAKEAVVSIAISERFKYKQNWRQGEKAGKVIILRDIHTQNTHAGHQRILLDLVKPAGVSNYEQLHQHWLQVLDVNILNKRFFQELANWYFWAMDNVSFPDDLEKKKDIRNATNLIRLITRVVFIWFIKEKSLVPGYLFNETYLNKILKDFNKNKKSQNYYRAILQNLFFGTLNQKMNERKFAKEGGIDTNKEEYGVKNLLRYADLFTIPEKEALQLFKDVPFLNGGLFDCLDKPNEDGKIVYVDGFSRNPKKQSSVPDYIFFGEEREVDLNEIFATKNKKYKSRGLINLLESYKFTVAENTPIEEEIALDPELLGKVFENLLASYNPETQTTARKQTGSFYTPREIVNYMVDESLLEYIKQNVNSESYAGKGEELEVKLRALISYEETPNPFNEKETKALIESINNCKILDPACGSGAFPMGILHKMVHLLQKLDPENIHWKELQRKKAMTETETAFKIGDKEERGRRLNEINDVFENNSSDYGRKLYLIENCIYGIDIQPIAVQISKLRFFISLVIDQNKQPDKENFGIRSLPNLETKFVAANTLIGLDKPVQTLLRNPEIENKENELKELRHKYFTANTRQEKLQYQKQDKKLRQEIAKLLENDGWDTKVAKQIVAFDPYDQNQSSGWFDPEWMYGLNDGFDVVIGNPPYIGEKGHKEVFRMIRQGTLAKFYQRKMDIFYFFFHLGLRLLKINGKLSFITTNYYLTSDGGEKLRTDLKNNSTVNSLINLNELKIFESAKGQHNLITFLTKGFNAETLSRNIITDETGECNPELFNNVISANPEQSRIYYVPQIELFETTSNYIRLQGHGNPINSTVDNSIFNKIIIQGTPLIDLCNISQGILSGVDRISIKHIKNELTDIENLDAGVYVLTNEEVNKNNFSSKELELLRPWFKSSDIHKYWTSNNSKYKVIYATRDIEIDAYPSIKKHFARFESVIKNRSQDRGEIQAAIKLGKWWVIFAARTKLVFEGEKIVCPQRTKSNIFGYNNTIWYSSADVYFITNATEGVKLKYILALLNSKLYYFWLYNKGKRKGESLELYFTPLTEIPVKRITLYEQQPFIELVDKIIDRKGCDTYEFEKKIDSLVYKIYGLTEEEIAIIENLSKK